MSETILRSRFLLSTIFGRNGAINEEVLQDLLSARTVRGLKRTTGSSDPMPLKRSEITTMLLLAVPPFTEDMPLDELLQMSIGLAAVLPIIGIGRKEAFILSELLQRLTPGLVEARKVGAAEMGIHPDAGPWSLGNASHPGFSRIEKRTKFLLRLVAALYASLHDKDRTTVSNSSTAASTGLIVSGLPKIHSNGNLNLKIDILKSCIAICEILPDFEGILKYTLHLLHLSRRAIIMPLDQPSDTPAISQEEQAKLLDGIKRTIQAATRLGTVNTLVDYWDEFLVRGVDVIQPPAPLRVMAHAKSSLESLQESGDTRKKDPFIYKPSHASISTVIHRPLVADEVAYFSITLQNPFEIGIEIDEICLIAEGCDFHASRHSIVLGHLCCQEFTMTGTPKNSGILKVKGCRAKIRCCKERDFHIYPHNARSGAGLTTRKFEYAEGDDLPGRQTAAAIEVTQDGADAFHIGPQSDTVILTVLEAQPFISLQSTSLSQPALMLLEGERRQIEIVLRNESSTIPADLVHFTFQDSASGQLGTALKNQDLSPSELYELQLQLAERTPFKHIANAKKGTGGILAGGTATFIIEVLGIPGLLNGDIQVDYAYLGMEFADLKETYYTRQLSLSVAVTVNAGVEAPRCNIQPFNGNFAWRNTRPGLRSSTRVVAQSNSLSSGTVSPSTVNQANEANGDQSTSCMERLGLDSFGGDRCLLLMDIRNAWPFPLSVSLQVGNGTDSISSSDSTWHHTCAVREVLQPGHMSRVLLLVPRLYVPDRHAPIPLIDNQRQFVVSSTRFSLQVEQANREAFWFREALLKRLRGSWREESTGREGSIDLRRGIRLNSRMIDTLKAEELEIDISLQSAMQPDDQSTTPCQRDHSRFVLPTNSFATLTIKIHNHSPKSVHTLLRVRPSVREQPHSIALDLSKRFAWTGMLQRALHPPIEAGEVRETQLGVMALCVGDYEIRATVEELKATAHVADGTSLAVPKPLKERRIWHAREPCLLDAVDSVQA